MAAALTVTLSVDNSSVRAGQLVTVTATIRDSGSTPTAWAIVGASPFVIPGDGASRGDPLQSQDLVVAASGTSYFSWSERFWTNGNNATPAATLIMQFSVGLTVTDSNGGSWSCAVGDRPTVDVTPNSPPGPTTAMPVPGQARFDSNLDSYMVVTVLAGH